MQSVLFVYKFPDTIFTPGTVQELTIYVTGANGSVIPDWLSYEDISMTLSGTPNATNVGCSIFVEADDRQGGYAFQSFNISISYLTTASISYIDLIIVCGALGGFILAAIIFLFAKNVSWRCCRCKKKQTDDEDDDSFEDNDDVCVDDAKVKNPFQMQKEL